MLEQAIDLRFALRNALLVLGEYERLSNTCVPPKPSPRLWVTSADSGRSLPIWGLHFHAMGEYDQAITAYQRTIATAAALGEMAIQVQVTLMQGITYYALGDYPRAMDCFSSNVAFLVGERRWERFGHGGLSCGVFP